MANRNMEKYMEIAEKYGIGDVKERMEGGMKAMENAPFTVGIIGNHFKIIPLLTLLTGIREMDGIQVGRSFFMEVTAGDETACFRLDGQEECKISFQEMRDALEESTPLDSEEQLPALQVHLTVADWKSEEVRLLAIGAADGFGDIQWQEALFGMDECCMVLSATRLLSMEERNFIRNGKARINTYILADMQQVPEQEGRSTVWQQLVSFVGGDGKNVVSADDGQCMNELWEIWGAKSRDTDAVDKKRREVLEEAVRRQLKSNLEKIKSVYQYDEKKIQDMANHLEKAYGELPSYKERTTRHVRMYYLEEMKSELEAELTGFHTKLRQDLKIGIDEEKDIKQLQSALAGYIAGEWETFLGKTLQVRLENTALRIDTGIESYINQNVEALLRQYLSEEEYGDLKRLIAGQLKENSIYSQDNNMEMDGSVVLFEGSGKSTFYGLLPKCVMAAGGIAILCSAFLPGALMVFMGYQMNSSAGEAAKEKLLQEGRQLSDQCLKEVQNKMQEVFRDMEENVAELVENCYDTVMNCLVSILEAFEKNNSDAQKMTAQIEMEIQELSREAAGGNGVATAE